MGRTDLRSRRAKAKAPKAKESSLVSKLAGVGQALVELARVRTDGGTQPRASLDESTLTEYAERMILDASAGKVVDPEGRAWEEIVVFDDGESLWLADGFHRVEAARRAGLSAIQGRVEEGGRRDAIRFSLGVNATHGKRRTRADKRRALERALCDDEWAQWADARLARMCKVTGPFVTKVRAELEREGRVPFQAVLYAADGRAFEREPVAPKAAPSPAPKRASARRAPRSKANGARHFKELGALDACGMLVAYPVTREDWSALAAGADAVVEANGCLVALLPAESPFTFAGPAMIDALVDAGRFKRAVLVHATAPGRTFAVWSRVGADVPAVVSGAVDITRALDLGQATIVGQSLDRW